MSSKNLSTVAAAVIDSYGHTALNMINIYRVGGERMIGFVDQRFEAMVNNGGAALGEPVRANLIDTQQRVSGYYSKGLHFGTGRAVSAVNTAVDLAHKGVDRIAANAERFDQATNIGAIEAINRVALPAAEAFSQVVERIEEGSSKLVERVGGQPATAEAVVKAAKKATKKATDSVNKKATAVKKTAVSKTNAATRKVRAAVNEAAAG